MRIGFIGKMGVGKSTSAAYLVDKYGYSKIALADKLKDICKELWPEEFEDGNKPRKLLQTIGTEKLRSYDENVWVNYLIRRIDKIDRGTISGRKWVVDDVRFINEAEKLKNNDFILIRIVGDSRISVPEGTSSHSSETEQDGIIAHHTIYNISTLEDLYKQIDEILKVYIP